MLNAEDVVRTYADMVYKIAYRYVGNPTDAEDVFSETFLSYFKREREFESEEHRKAWLIRVTINAAKDFLKSRGSWEELNEEIDAPAQEPLDREDILTLRDAILRLPEKQREIICLYYLQDLPIREIAGILDMNENTVKVTLMRSREKLRRLLEE